MKLININSSIGLIYALKKILNFFYVDYSFNIKFLITMNFKTQNIKKGLKF
jgi:hypothetical protein